MKAHPEWLLCALYINKLNKHNLCHQEAHGLVDETDCKSNNQIDTYKMAIVISTVKGQKLGVKRPFE